MGRNCSSKLLDHQAYGPGSAWQPIEVNDTSTLNNIGLNDAFPSSAHYVQTTDLNGTALHGNESLVFNGHYDGRNHSIEGLQTCLFSHLQGTVKNLRLTNANISGNGQPAAVVACTMSEAGAIEHVHLSDCHVTNRGSAGVISGERVDWFNRVAGAVVHNSTLETSGPDAPAGMIAGKCHGETKAVDIHSSRVVTHGQGSHAGLGCGTSDSWVNQMVSTCSEVETHGNDAFAGIGVGRSNYGGIGPLTSVNSSVATSGARSPAGIGAGQARRGWLEEIDAVHSRVATTGAESSSGVGAGALGYLGGTKNVTAVHCDVITEGNEAHAGICSGDRMVTVSYETYCTSVDSSASALGEDSRAYFVNPDRQAAVFKNNALNTRVNGRLFNTGDVGNLSTLCSTADSRFIKPDCQATLAQSCPMLQSFYLPPTITDQIIEVTNAATLGKIGTDPNYPLNASYIQTTDIDASSLSHPISHFTGQYNGQHHSITNLACCLVDSLEGHGAIGNLHFTGARIIASRPAGVVACSVVGNGTIHDILVDHSQVMTSGNDADAGIGAGVLLGGTLVNTTTVNSTVITSGKGADAGIGSGSIGNGAEVSHTASLHSRVETAGDNANAAIGAGIMNNGAAAIGTSAVNSQVETSGDGANAGIGAGKMGRDTVAKDTSAQESLVSTSGDGASAGIGVGVMDHRARIAGIRSDNSRVKTSGVRANAGIGAGAIRGNATLTDTWAVNSTAIASGNETSAGIGAGWIEPGGLVTNTTKVGSFARATGYSSPMAREPAVVPTTPAPVTETVATVADTSMTFSGLPGATMALPTGVAPLATSLSTSAIAGIALGAVAFVLAGVAGVCIYRHYHRRPSPADVGGPQELVVIDSAGKTQEVSGQPLVADGTGEAEDEPAYEQYSEITPPKPPRLNKWALPEKPTASDPFLEELREHVSPWHEHIYEDMDTCHSQSMSTAAGRMDVAK